MAQYDVYHLSDGLMFVDVQSDLLDVLEVRMIIPMDSYQNFQNHCIDKLNPVVRIKGVDYVLKTQNMTSVFCHGFNTPVANISEHHFEITNALDFLFQGF